ncbi:class I tRNA ligase family protein [Candidatus Saccharibacteria bacterium]|nr:class I tRNA ligase family protein [Candidatus Saccharibacteria bacterium]
MECVNQLYKVKNQGPSTHSISTQGRPESIERATRLRGSNFSLVQEAWRDGLIALTQLLAPFAPHIAEEIWAELGQAGSVHISQWPAWNEELVQEDLITIVVQVNGKVRAELLLPSDTTEKEAVEAAKNDDKVAKNIAGKKIKKAIYVPGRLVSLVV